VLRARCQFRLFLVVCLSANLGAFFFFFVPLSSLSQSVGSRLSPLLSDECARCCSRHHLRFTSPLHRPTIRHAATNNRRLRVADLTRSLALATDDHGSTDCTVTAMHLPCMRIRRRPPRIRSTATATHSLAPSIPLRSTLLLPVSTLTPPSAVRRLPADCRSAHAHPDSNDGGGGLDGD